VAGPARRPDDHEPPLGTGRVAGRPQFPQAGGRGWPDYWGLPFEDRGRPSFENARPVRTASSEQVRQPIYRDGVDHWRNVEPWLEPLKHALGPVLAAYPAPPASFG